MAEEYSAKNIIYQTDRESARSRVATYLGSASSNGLHHCIWEVVDNAIDEAMAGYCDSIIVTLHKNGYISVEDNGRGIPVDIHPEYKMSALRLLCTTLHSGGKMNNDVYKTSGGLNGMGLFLTVACSEKAIVEVSRNGKLYYDEYEHGFPVTKLTTKGALPTRRGVKTTHTGTRVYFKGDSEVFETTEYKPEIIKKRLHMSAYLNPGVKLVFIDENKKENDASRKIIFEETEGIVGYLKEINKDETTITEPIYFKGKSKGIEAEIAMQYIDDSSELIVSYTNSVATIDGGEHETGFKAGLTKLINYYAKELDFLKASKVQKVGKSAKTSKETSFKGKDVRFGLTAVISLKHPNPQFEGQTKTKLGNQDARLAVDEIVNKEGSYYFDRHLDDVNLILTQAKKSMDIRNKTDKIKSLAMSKENQLQTNGKLASALSKKPSECEIFIVEGDSAGGSAKMGRDSKIQAILPLRGKIINVEKAPLEKVLANKEIQTMILAFGCGYRDDFDISKLKYDKIIIMTDADIDGDHIRSLFLTFIMRYMPQLISEGKVYKAVPPLYKVSFTGGGRVSKTTKENNFVYAYSDKELNEIREKLENDKRTTKKISNIQRYKGLGEMSAEQLWETTMDPATRKLNRITIDDVADTSHEIDVFMGPKADRRKKIILENQI